MKNFLKVFLLISIISGIIFSSFIAESHSPDVVASLQINNPIMKIPQLI